MTTLDEMWAALAAYQPQADATGHGVTWAKMCSEKTYGTADAAADAAAAADADAYAADYAAAADAAADVKKWARIAINSINKVLDQTSHDNFKPDYNTEAVLVEEMQRMAKRIEELEAMLEHKTARIVDLQTHIENFDGDDR